MDLEHERRLTEVESKADSNKHRLDEVERRQDNLDELVSTVKVLANREENVENDLKEVKTDVKSLINKPAQRWESVVDKIIMMIIGAVVGFILTKLGL